MGEMAGAVVGMHAHLFDGDTLVGNVIVGGPAALDQLYTVDGVRYRTISYMEVTEWTGRRGLDVQVAPARLV
jgi:hypothetical protein